MTRSLSWSRAPATRNLSSDSMLRSRWTRRLRCTGRELLLGSWPSNAVQGRHHRRAIGLDVLPAGRLGDLARLVGADVELQPQRFGADGRGLARDRGGVRGGPEDVDDVDLLGHVEQGAVDLLAEQRVGVGVDRDDAKAATLEPGRDGSARLAGVA